MTSPPPAPPPATSPNTPANAPLTDLNALVRTRGAAAPTPQGAVEQTAPSRLDPSVIAPKTGGPKPRARQAKRVLTLLKQAQRRYEANDYPATARLALDALALDEHSPDANHMMAVALDRLGHLSRSLEFYEKVWKLTPNDPQVYLNIGGVAWKLDMMETAEKFYRIAMRLDPANLDTRVNLGGVLRDTGRFEDAIELLRESLYAAPDAPGLWNALATVLLHSGEPVEAQTFYHEALRLKPDFTRAWHNLAYARNTAGDARGALEASETALKHGAANPSDEYEIRHSRALSLLSVGRLAEGWRAYEVRLDPAHGPIVFKVEAARLTPDAPAAGRAVLLMGEQGVGDEVLHYNAAADLAREIGPDGRLIMACEWRLAPLVRRAFPDALVNSHRTIEKEGRKVRAAPWASGEDAPEAWLPAASLLERYRSRLEDFPSAPRAYLPPDPDRVAGFRAALDALGPGLKVGLCWKSKLMSAARRKYFSAFEAWRPVLQTPGVTFVSMQYGDIAEEVAWAQREWGVDIHTLDVDLMDDLDGVAALGAALDLTIGPMNASTNLAAAAGGLIWIVALSSHWPLFGLDRLAFYPGSRAFSPRQAGDWDGAMAEVADALSQAASQGGVAAGAAGAADTAGAPAAGADDGRDAA